MPKRIETAADLLNAQDEVVLSLADGWTLRSGVVESAFISGEYVRLCRPDETEYAYWAADEWRDDPVLIMGAIINAAAGYRPGDHTGVPLTEPADHEVTIISERGVEYGVVEGNSIRVTSGAPVAHPSLSHLWGELHELCDNLSPHAWVRRSAEIEGRIRVEERMHQRDLLRRCAVLVRLLTVRQVIEAGDEAIAAAGLHPYALNEGRATGDERLDPWWLETE